MSRLSYLAIFVTEIAFVGAGSAAAQPAGGVIVAGQASIATPSSSSTLITQSSQKAIIDWQSFSVGSGATVQFAQPNSAALTLNRVTGNGASAIEGAIRANGQVWLINPNGVLFGQGATIHVGGLLATTADIANGDFLSGNYSFSAGTSAPVINQGSIHAAKGGSVVLSGRSVSNTGIIEARAGHVVLGGADAFTVDFAGDNLLSYAVTTPVAAATTDKNGNRVSASVSNTGIIRAPGGKVLLTARAAAGVADGVVNNTGTITATTAHMENGEVVLDAGDGEVADSGTLDASGKAAGATGGSVQVLGNTVKVADGAKIDVSGDAGGGTVLIGGNFHGAGPQANAQTTTVGKAVINADAIRSGNGGKVAVWSDGNTRFAGSISAKGGAVSGNGGQIETSGHNLAVDPAAKITASAPAGVAGNWLLDPTNITISSTNPGNDTPGTLTNGTLSSGTDPGQNDYVTPATIENALYGTNGTDGTSVSLNATNNITVVSAIAPTAYTGTSVPQLSLNAGGLIAVNAQISLANYGLSLQAGGNITQSAAITAASLSATSTGGSITLTNTANQIATTIIVGTDGNGNPTETPTGTVTLSAVGNVSFTNANETVLGNVTVTPVNSAATLDIEVLDAPASTSHSDLVLSAQTNVSGTGDTTLHTTGNIINLNGTSQVTADALNLISDYGSIGAPEPDNTNSSYFFGATINSLHVLTHGGGTDPDAPNTPISGGLLISSSTAFSIGTDQGGINTGSGGGFIGASNNTTITQASGSNGTIITSGNLAISSGTGGFTLNNPGNQVSGQLSLYSPGPSSFTNSGNTVVNQIIGSAFDNTASSAGAVTLVVNDGSVMEASGGLIKSGDLSVSTIDTTCSNCGIPAPYDITLAEANNQVAGVAVFNSTGNTSFTNSINTLLGVSSGSVIGGNLDVELNDNGQSDPSVHSTLTLNGYIQTQQTTATGDSVLHATGDLINNANNSVITATNLSLVSDNGAVGACCYTFQVFGNNSNPVNLHVSAPNGSILLSAADFNIGTDLAGPGLQAQSILIFGNGVITQNADSTGTIVTPSFDAHAGGDITLTNPNNAASVVAFTTTGNATFYNSVQTTINRGSADHDSNGNELPMGNLDLEVADPSGAAFPGIYVLGNSITDSIDSSGTVTLHAAGAITSSTNPIIGSSVMLISDTAGIGTPSAPMLVTASILVATSSNQDIIIKATGQNGMLTVGDGATGINAGTGNVALIADGSRVSGTDTITANNLRVSGQSIALSDVEVTTLNADSGGGAIYINSNGAFMLDNITGAPGTAAINSSGGNVHLTAAGGISQATGTAGEILAGGLDADPAQGASLTLDNPGNQVSGTVTLRGVNNVTFANAINTFLGTSSAGGTFTAVSAGNLTIVRGATLTAGAGGNALVLSAAGNFINNAGSGALSLMGGGRFLIYSQNPANDVFGNLDSANTAIWNTAYPTAITASGNRYVFAFQPTITVAAGNLSKTYGTDDSAAIAADYTITGLQGGVANAFRGDAAASVYNGTPSVTATGGTAANAAVGNYAINAGGTVTTMDGYALALQNGTLSVNPAILLYTADSASRAFGAANPAFTGSVTGFVNGETLASATSGSLNFTSPAQASSAAGLYGIFGSGLKAGNYLFQQAPSNSTALTIVASSSNPGAVSGGGNPGANSAAQVGATPSFQSFYVSNQSAAASTALGLQYSSAGPSDDTGAISVPIVSAEITALPQVTHNPIENLAQANPGDDSTDPPTSSDLDTGYLAASFDGGGSGKKANGNGGIIIPGLLKATAGRTQTLVVSGNDLSGWGNSALWQ